MVLIRKVAAILSLAALAGLAVTLESGSYGVNPRLVVLTRALLPPMGFIMIGLALEESWSRWLALAVALAVLPWAVVLTFGLPGGAPLGQQTIALFASLALLVSLSGRTMLQRYEGNGTMDWTGPRRALARWTLILTVASVLDLLLFVVLYRATVWWHMAIPATLLVGLAAGALLLGLQRTVGLLLVGAACILFVPAGTYFVWKEASYAGEAYLFAACFAPGVIAGWVCLAVFGRPIWSLLRLG